MSPSIQAPSRSLLRVLKSSRQSCECTRPRRLLQPSSQRYVSSTTSPNQQDSPSKQSTPSSQVPRWSQTPAAMKAPVRTRPKPAGWQPFPVNNDPTKLDAMYARFLGKTGPKMLSDETKWLAITHKSFDHGRRGFNDRLSFLGRQIVELQTSLGLLTAADANSFTGSGVDVYGRQPFFHPATGTVEILNGGGKAYFMHHKQMSSVARSFGIPEVVRWQPRDVSDLGASGCDMVYAQALFAIVGALSLEQGGQVANRVVRERILQNVGMKVESLNDNAAQQQQQVAA